MESSIMSKKLDNIQHWKVVGALRKPNDICLKEKLTYGNIKFVFFYSSREIDIWL